MSTLASSMVSIPTDKLAEELLALPRVVREHLAGILRSSLDDQDLGQIWDEEADHRYRAYLAGELTAIPAKEAMAHLRAQLRK